MTFSAMPSIRSTARRFLCSGSRAVLAVAVGTGIALTPLPALAAPAVDVAAVAEASSAARGSAAQIAVHTAMAQRGKPFGWGASGPNRFDCSGLVMYAYGKAGVRLPHSSGGQSRMGRPVSRADLRPGDLIFFYRPVGHVAMYIGNGQMVYAPSSGDVVKVGRVANMPGYNSARRVG
jgi:cell wall-associated NlpC family hydrolase